MPSSVRARRSSAPTSSTAAATRRWGAPGRTSTSPPSAARRSGRTRRRATRRPRRTGGGTTTTPTARKRDRTCHEVGDLLGALEHGQRLSEASLAAPACALLRVEPHQYGGEDRTTNRSDRRPVDGPVSHEPFPQEKGDAEGDAEDDRCLHSQSRLSVCTLPPPSSHHNRLADLGRRDAPPRLRCRPVPDRPIHG